MSDAVRLALVGCGAVADLYMPVFKRLACADIMAAVDIDPGAARNIAARYEVERVYGDVEEAARDADIDAFIIGTPPNLHAEHIEIAAAHGKHVLCEKPMASTVQDCLRIIDACKRGKVKLQLGHMKRFMRGNQKAKAIVDSGILGKIFMTECHWDCAVPQLIGSYREQGVTGGGSLQDHGPHAFDLIRWWTGNDIIEVSATMRSVHPNRPAEDAVVATLGHENGMFSYYHMTRISYGREHAQDTYRVYGADGTLVVRNDHHFPTMSLESPEILLYRPGGECQRLDTFHGWNLDDCIAQNFPFYNQLYAFCECVQGDTEPLVTGEDGLHTIEALLAAYVSAWKGIKVKLPFRDEVDLAALFGESKRRDAKNLKYDYAVEAKRTPMLEIRDPILGHRPPKTKEKWSHDKHGGEAKYAEDSLSGRLTRR